MKTVKKKSAILSGTALLAVLIAFMFPAIYIVCLSLTAENGGAMFSLEQYRLLFGNAQLKRRLLNSCTLSIKTLVLQLPLSIMGGVMLTRCMPWLKRAMLVLLLLMLLLPFQTYMFPVFILFKRYGLYDTHKGLILFAAFSPLGPLTVYSFMRAIPNEQWEAASLDTSSFFRTVFHVILPQLKPMLATLTLLCFTEIWNMVDPAIVLLQKDDLFPASLSLNDNKAVSWAAATAYLSPILLLYVPTVYRKAWQP